MKLSIFKHSFIIFLSFLTYLLFASASYAQADILPTSSPTPSPTSQIIKLDFHLPGIGSESGNTKPIHSARSVFLNFYKADVNSEDTSVRPVATINVTANFDSDPSSPTFGEFINPNIDYSQNVPEGVYQISIKVENSLPSLVKNKEKDIGGKKFDIKHSFSQPIIIDGQNIITGDIYPSITGNNIMDIKDYNALTGCFGSKADSDSCFDKTSSDLNDDGTVDGTDYNLMLSGFKILLERGFPVPSILFPNQITPKITIAKQITLQPTKAKGAQKKSLQKVKTTPKTSSAWLIFIFIFLVLILIVIIFFIRRRRKHLAFDKKFAEKQESQLGITSESTEQISEMVEKEFFVKKQTLDANGSNVLTLTDDNGPMLGYYKGDVTDGFAKVKGIIKKEGSKVFMDVSEITPETDSKPQA